MNKAIVLLSLITLVVAVSGCIAPGGITGVTGGAVSASFSVDTTEVPKGSRVGAFVTVDNKALVSIDSVNVTLFGPVDWTGLPSSKSAAKIRPNDYKEFVWTLTAPTVSVDTPYTINAEILYHMNTNKSITITVVTYDYYKRTGAKSSITPSPVDVGGPIKVDFGGIGRIQYLYEGDTSIELPVKVLISNVGPGKAANSTSMTLANLNNVIVRIEPSDGKLKCTEDLGGSGYGPSSVYLTRDGATASMACALTGLSYTDVQGRGGSATYTATVFVDYYYDQVITSPQILVTTELR